MLDITFAGAALAGILSFFTPCILPMVPFYLSYMAGISMSELSDDGEISPGAQARMVVSAVFFALGVTTIFVLLGMGATAMGQLFIQWKGVLTYVAGAVLLVFGLHFLGVVRIGLLYRDAHLNSRAQPHNFFGAYVMGLVFGFGWTPCVGPALAAILMIAGGMGDIWQGGALLFVYGVSMTAPFIVAAVFAKPFLRWAQRNKRYMVVVEKVMGAMLILFAALIVTGSVDLIADAMIRWFPAFGRIG